MSSRAERSRRFELASRVVGLAALGILLAGAVWGGGERGRGVQLERRPDAALPRWTIAPPAETLAVAVDRVPDRVTRAWLAAIRGAGTMVRWTAHDVPVVAVEARGRTEPRAGAVVRVAAPAGATIAVADSVGLLDTATAGAGAVFAVPRPVGGVTARAGTEMATTDADHVLPRRVVVIGDAGWESRFVIRALEERGWAVDARLALGPGRFTEQGRPLPLDTARHGVVVVLDSVPADVAVRVVGFVRHGGGLVLGERRSANGSAVGLGPSGLGVARRSALGARQVAPAGFGEVIRPSELAFASGEPRAALAYRPLVALRGDAVVLERRDGRVVVAARRERAGRVVQVGYEETWRWRMLGGDNAPAAHAAWWSGVVAAAAYSPADRRTGGPVDRVDPAPYAALVDALGEPVETLSGGARSVPRVSFAWLLALAVTSFMAEWASRRLRGES